MPTPNEQMDLRIIENLRELLPAEFLDAVGAKEDDFYPGIIEMVKRLVLEGRYQGIENGIRRATGGYSWSMPMKSVRTRNTAFKLYAVKFFNGKIKERREALLAQLKNEKDALTAELGELGE